MNIAAIVLAAGAGRRMGGPKTDLRLGGQTFLERILTVAKAAGVHRHIVVRVGGAEPLASLQMGLRAAGDVDGVLVWPVDHPGVLVETVIALLAQVRRQPEHVIVPCFEGRGGHPTFFPRRFFDELLALPATESARVILVRHTQSVVRLELPDPAVRMDVDTWDDFMRIRLLEAQRMKTSLSTETSRLLGARLHEANRAFAARRPGESARRQPVHTVYGGAHIFKADTAQKLGKLALRSLNEHAHDAATFAAAVGIEPTDLARAVYERVLQKLAREPVEDFRIDFEDGYGNRPDAEEDDHAVAAARETAKGMREHTLPPFIGIRIKPFTEDLRERSFRTLDLYLTALASETGGKLPENFVVTLPKVTLPEQVATIVDLFATLEPQLGMDKRALKIELMIETPQAIINEQGEAAIVNLVEASDERCTGAHFGTYDYTASLGITASEQRLDHRACDFAKHVMQVALAGTEVWLSDGATNVMPVGTREAVLRGWRLHYGHVRHSLAHGYFQGWDLHPAQLPTRYAAVYAFFLEALPSATERLRSFVGKAAQATLVGDVFDDAATGQGLLNFFLRGIGCGALTESEALATGLTTDELRTRSFLRILRGRKGS